MAPTKGSAKAASSGGPKGSKTPSLSSASRVSKSSKKNVKRPPPQEVKSKARTAPENLQKKKKRVYTEAELDLPKLNSITPVGVVKPKGKKKGKTFVDDQVRHFAPQVFCARILIFLFFCNIGGYVDNPCYRQCREGGSNRVEDDEGTPIGGDPGSQTEGNRGSSG